MSNFFLVWKWNHFIAHQLQVNIEFFCKIKELTFHFNLRYFCFLVNYSTLTYFKKCLKILSELTLNKVDVSHNLAQQC